MMAYEGDILTCTAEIVASYLGNAAHVQASELLGIIKSVRAALSEAPVATSDDVAVESGQPKPSKREITKSVTPDVLFSFLDNKPYKTLKRHLSTRGMDMASYRERYGLPHDYPSVAPN